MEAESNVRVRKGWFERWHILMKLIYVAHGITFAPIGNFFVSWLSYKGFDASQIGVVAAIAPFASLIGTPILTGIADKTQRHSLVWFLAVLVSCLVITSSIWLSFHVAIVAVIFSVYTGIRSSGSPLMDARAIEVAGKDGYGRQRVMLSISAGVTAFVVGILADKLKLSIFIVHFVGTVLLLALIIVDSRFRKTEKADREKEHEEKRSPSVDGSTETQQAKKPPQISFFKSLKVLLGNCQFIVVILRSFSTGFAQASIGFVFLYIKQEFEVGERLHLIYGICVFATVLGEIPVFIFQKQIQNFFGSELLMLISHSVMALRVFLYTVIPRNLPFLLVAVECLHGLMYSTFWMAAVTSAHEAAPSNLQSLSQGIVSSMYTGFGWAVGSLLDGFLFKVIGPVNMYRGVAAFCVVELLLSGTNTLALFLAKRRKATSYKAVVELEAPASIESERAEEADAGDPTSGRDRQ